MEEHDEFEQWYRATRPRLIVTLTAFCGDIDLAADHADEALLRAYERWERVRVMESPGGWTYTTALNALRRGGRRHRLENAAFRRLHRRPEDETDDPPRMIEFMDLVGSIPAIERTAVILRYVGQLTEPEIAELTSTNRGTVSSRLRRALTRVKPLTHYSEKNATEGEPKCESQAVSKG